MQSADTSLLGKPSPLSLSLTKSPSFLDLIQSKFFQRNAVNADTSNLNSEVKKKSHTCVKKLQALNFPAIFKILHVFLCLWKMYIFQ